MSAQAYAPDANGNYTYTDREGDVGAAPGATVTRNAQGEISAVDLDGADRYQAQKGFDAAARDNA